MKSQKNMNSRITTVILGTLLVGSLLYATYTGSKLTDSRREFETCKEKYGEALIDAQEALKRLEEKDEEVKKLLVVAEFQRKRAEEALAELQNRGRR